MGAGAKAAYYTGAFAPRIAARTFIPRNPVIEPIRIPRSEHPISRTNVAPGTLRVLYGLKDAGYEAYIVGGGVRDLLAGFKPKDFDVATNAHPEQIRKVFRSCRLIGRRFVIAHVRMGEEIVEVA